MKTHITYIFLLIFLSIFCFKEYKDLKESQIRMASNLKSKQDTIFSFKNKYDKIQHSKLALESTSKDLENSLYNSKLELKKTKKILSYTKKTQKVIIDTIKVVFRDTVPYVFNRDFTYATKWYSMTGAVTNNGFKIDSLELENEQEIALHRRSLGLFKGTELKIDVSNSNPYFREVKIESHIVIDKKKWYENPFYTIPAGVFIGYVVSK